VLAADREAPRLLQAERQVIRHPPIFADLCSERAWWLRSATFGQIRRPRTAFTGSAVDWRSLS
jgi:hypothetical protein